MFSLEAKNTQKNENRSLISRLFISYDVSVVHMAVYAS